MMCEDRHCMCGLLLCLSPLTHFRYCPVRIDDTMHNRLLAHAVPSLAIEAADCQLSADKTKAGASRFIYLKGLSDGMDCD
jgi:hypothetical protein